MNDSPLGNSADCLASIVESTTAFHSTRQLADARANCLCITSFRHPMFAALKYQVWRMTSPFAFGVYFHIVQLDSTRRGRSARVPRTVFQPSPQRKSPAPKPLHHPNCTALTNISLPSCGISLPDKSIQNVQTARPRYNRRYPYGLAGKSEAGNRRSNTLMTFSGSSCLHRSPSTPCTMNQGRILITGVSLLAATRKLSKALNCMPGLDRG